MKKIGLSLQSHPPLVAASADIIAANKEDLENGKKNHMPEGLLDRLMLNEARIAQIA